MHLLIAEKGPFIGPGFPQIVKKKFGIPYQIVEGSHMFPLERPEETVTLIKTLIQESV